MDELKPSDKSVFKECNYSENQEMIHHFKALVALAEDSELIPSAHMVVL